MKTSKSYHIIDKSYHRETPSDVSLNSSSSELFTSLKLVHIPKDKKGELSRDLVHKR